MERVEILDNDTAEALQLIRDGVARLQSTELEHLLDFDVRACLLTVEECARKVGSLQVEVLGEIDRRALYSADGHANAKVMARHLCQLSAGEAAGRVRAMKALRHLPEVAAAYRAGEIGTCQVRLMSRVHANPRAREALTGFQGGILELAASYSFHDFELAVRRWERLENADGPAHRNDANHRSRDVRLVQNTFDLSWDLTGRFGALQGSALREILDHFIQAEREADWDEARRANGEGACEADLARTDAQRRADALVRMANDAASCAPGASAPDVVHNIVWDADTYLSTLDRLDPSGQKSDSPFEQPLGRNWYDPATYRCETLDGVPLEPLEAALSSLSGQVRRVLLNARGVVVDLGRRARLFTGSARLAVKLQSPTCNLGQPFGLLAAGCRPAPARPTTFTPTPMAGPPAPATEPHCAAGTTAGNKKGSLLGKTPPAVGAPDDPMAAK